MRSWTPAAAIGDGGHWSWRSRVGRGSSFLLRRRHDQAQAHSGDEARGEEGGMTDRRDEEHKRMRREREARERRQEQEADESRREDVEKRFDDLKEAWRRHHPSEHDEGGQGRPKKGRPA